MNYRKAKEGSKKIESAFSFWGDSVGSHKSGFDEIYVFKFVSWLEDNLVFGKFFGGKLRKEFSDFLKFGFCHMQVVIIA